MLTILTCRCLDRMKAFYRAAFSWPEVVDTPNYLEMQVDQTSFLGLMDASLSQTFVGDRLISLEGDQVRPLEIYLRVENPQEGIMRLEKAGAELTSAFQPRSWGEEAAYLLDPEGTVIAIAGPVRSFRVE